MLPQRIPETEMIGQFAPGQHGPLAEMLFWLIQMNTPETSMSRLKSDWRTWVKKNCVTG
jgi:hypothetical protein